MSHHEFRAFFVFESDKDAEEAKDEAESTVTNVLESTDGVEEYEVDFVHEPHDVAREVDPVVDFTVEASVADIKNQIHTELFDQEGVDHFAEV